MDKAHYDWRREIIVLGTEALKYIYIFLLFPPYRGNYRVRLMTVFKKHVVGLHSKCQRIGQPEKQWCQIHKRV